MPHLDLVERARVELAGAPRAREAGAVYLLALERHEAIVDDLVADLRGRQL